MIPATTISGYPQAFSQSSRSMEGNRWVWSTEFQAMEVDEPKTSEVHVHRTIPRFNFMFWALKCRILSRYNNYTEQYIINFFNWKLGAWLTVQHCGASFLLSISYRKFSLVDTDEGVLQYLEISVSTTTVSNIYVAFTIYVLCAAPRMESSKSLREQYDFSIKPYVLHLR